MVWEMKVRRWVWGCRLGKVSQMGVKIVYCTKNTENYLQVTNTSELFLQYLVFPDFSVKLSIKYVNI